jgi:hypothetical protein
MEHIITGCTDCPLLEVDNEYGDHNCNHPLVPTEIRQEYGRDVVRRIEIELEEFCCGDPITPNWCPLKKESLTLKFEQ